MATRLFCDTDCELWYTETNEVGIDVIKMPYILDGVEYLYDLGESTDFKNFYQRMREGAIPTTSALNEYNYTEIFEPVFAAGEDIFYISFSSELSATFNFMNSAIEKLKEKYPDRKFTHFDTKGISTDCGLHVYYGAKFKNEGHTDEELLAYLEGLTKKVETFFAVDDLNHLKRGGRLSAVAATFGTILGLKPIITLTPEGKLKPIDKVKGYKKVISYFCEKFKEKTDAQTLEKYDVWVLHGDNESRALELKTRLLEVHPTANIRTLIVGPVIATHCGPNTLAVIFVCK